MDVILLYSAIWVHSILEDRQQRYFGCRQISKRIYAMFDDMRHQRTVLPGPYIDRGEEPINRFSNKKKP